MGMLAPFFLQRALVGKPNSQQSLVGFPVKAAIVQSVLGIECAAMVKK